MPKVELPPFHRYLDANQEPTDYQRRFLYLPLSIFREHTNIRSIIQKHDPRKDNKPQKEIEINQKIKKYHSAMGSLKKWRELHLDKLEFIWPKDGICSKRVYVENSAIRFISEIFSDFFFSFHFCFESII